MYESGSSFLSNEVTLSGIFCKASFSPCVLKSAKSSSGVGHAV